MERAYKDPNSIEWLPAIPWSRRLGSATIATSAWSFTPTGLTQVSTSISGADTSVLVSGGSAGTRYTVTNRITTSDSQTLDYSFELVCQEA